MPSETLREHAKVVNAESGLATIFVADDNPILLQGLNRALSANGYAVQTAGTGVSLLRLLQESAKLPDLLLLDVMMPEMSGIDVLQRLQEDARWASLPVILITAATDEQLPVAALQQGAVDFLTKPFRLGELLARVEAHVGRYRELQRARSESQVRLQVIDVVRDLNSVVTATEMFELVTSRLARIWGVGGCSVAIAEGDGSVRVAASAQERREAQLSVADYPEIEAALGHGAPVLIEDVAVSPLFDRLRARATASGSELPIRSALAFPFRISEQRQGVLLLRAGDDEPRLDNEALATAAQMVEGMSQALDRAQVFETLVEQRRHLHDLANTDELTGCATRRAVLGYLGDELGLARRRDAPLAVVILDLDNFKEINDHYGHLAGDAVLRTFGEWLRGEGAHRAKDCAGRFGGDEFVVVLPETGPEGALRFAERAREYLSSVTFVFGDAPTRASLSAGVAAWPNAAVDTVEQLVECADLALYEAKQAGRDCIRLARLNGDFHVEAP